MPSGQERALTSLVDIVRLGGAHAVLLLCHHNQTNVDIPIDVATGTVDYYYFEGKWHSGMRKTAKEATDIFLEYCGLDNILALA